MITIEQPYITELDGKSKLVADIIVDDKTKQVFFEVNNEYAKYLCYERSDAFLIGVLNYAMRFNHNIVCKAPVTEELLYSINEYLLPSLAINDKALSLIAISAPTEAEPMKNAGGVGTGLSCGVDSFHAIHNLKNSKYKSMNLTHLCTNSVGSFHRGYAKYGMNRARDDVRKLAVQVAEELNLPLIISDSNIKKHFDISFGLAHTYYSMFAVYCLQKLWKIYYYSSGVMFSDFTLKENSKNDTAFYDLLTLHCFSTHNLQLYSEGATEDRLEKTRTIINDELAQKYLHVCCTKGYNCGVCLKCRRTLLTLDILGKLDEFKESFNIDYYKAHRNEYLNWLYKSCQTKNIMLAPIYEALKHEFDFKFKLRYKLTPLIKKIYEKRVENNRVKLRLFFIKFSYKTKKQ